MSACRVDDCESQAICHGLCNKHYIRLRTRGTTDPRRVPSLEERFWAKVQKGPGCWTWIAGRTSEGYGAFASGSGLAHRFSYELHRGSIPDGLHIDHLCRNRLCVNPEHLEAVTSAENTRRGMAPTIVLNRQNQCSRGHEMTPENVYVRRDNGARQCRACCRERDRDRRNRKRAA